MTTAGEWIKIAEGKNGWKTDVKKKKVVGEIKRRKMRKKTKDKEGEKVDRLHDMRNSWKRKKP